MAIKFPSALDAILPKKEAVAQKIGSAENLPKKEAFEMHVAIDVIVANTAALWHSHQQKKSS